MIKEYHCIGKQTWYAKMGNENKQGVIGEGKSRNNKKITTILRGK